MRRHGPQMAGVSTTTDFHDGKVGLPAPLFSVDLKQAFYGNRCFVPDRNGTEFLVRSGCECDAATRYGGAALGRAVSAAMSVLARGRGSHAAGEAQHQLRAIGRVGLLEDSLEVCADRLT